MVYRLWQDAENRVVLIKELDRVTGQVGGYSFGSFFKRLNFGSFWIRFSFVVSGFWSSICSQTCVKAMFTFGKSKFQLFIGLTEFEVFYEKEMFFFLLFSLFQLGYQVTSLMTTEIIIYAIEQS